MILQILGFLTVNSCSYSQRLITIISEEPTHATETDRSKDIEPLGRFLLSAFRSSQREDNGRWRGEDDGAACADVT